MTLTAPQFCDHNPTLPIDYSHKQGIVETSGESQFSVRQVIMVMEAHSTFSSMTTSPTSLDMTDTDISQKILVLKSNPKYDVED